jgi:hypothetical protein
MVDIFKSLNLEYVCAVAGSSFRGLHESVINYGGNKNPEFITCCHEPACFAAAFRRIGGARLQNRHDAPDGAGAARGR